MNPTYTIIKLKSGEELICSVVKKEDNEVTLKIPMVFKTLILPDPYTGVQKEITVLRDWIAYGKENEISLPSDYILTYTNPEESAVELYGKELEKKFSDSKPKRKLQNYNDLKKDLQEELEDLLDDIAPDESSPPMNDSSGFKTWGMIPINEDILREMMKGFKFEDGEGFDIEFDFTFPPEELNPEESTEDELNHPDFGNRWTDWSSNPREY